MLAIAFTFPAGRYHATPWNRHVNEADVAWPPDLWRISRALIAVWHRKLDAVQFPQEQLAELLATLAVAPAPVFRVPEAAIHGHSRHYMPGKSDKRSLVFDAFARINAEDPIIVAWSDLHLDPAREALLDALLDNLGYLGRAESWVEARRTDSMPEPNCRPADTAVDMQTGESHGDIVRLLSPAAPQEYLRFRRQTLADAGITLDHGEQPTGKLNAKQKRLLDTLPLNWLDAVGVDTGDLQAVGWSAPPAATTVSYLRPVQALRTIAPRVRRPPVPSSGLGPTTLRYAVYGKPLPRIEDAVRIGEALRAAAMGRAKRDLSEDTIPCELSGHMEPGNRHAHAFWLPEDADRDGRIDHLLVHVPGGMSNTASRALTALQFVKHDDGEPLRLMLEGMGSSEMLGSVSAYVKPSRVWRSVTPYLHPWHLKKPALRDEAATLAAIEEQIRREWALRGGTLPAIESITPLAEVEAGGRKLKPLDFHRFRRKRDLTQPDTRGRFFELRFSETVCGPIALGFACHFGLGVFASTE